MWEIAIKQFIKKLNIESSIVEIKNICEERDIQILSIDENDIEKTKLLPDVHRDPFDRLIIAQAKNRKMKIITSDKNFKKYLKDVVEY